MFIVLYGLFLQVRSMRFPVPPGEPCSCHSFPGARSFGAPSAAGSRSGRLHPQMRTAETRLA